MVDGAVAEANTGIKTETALAVGISKPLSRAPDVVNTLAFPEHLESQKIAGDFCAVYMRALRVLDKNRAVKRNSPDKEGILKEKEYGLTEFLRDFKEWSTIARQNPRDSLDLSMPPRLRELVEVDTSGSPGPMDSTGKIPRKEILFLRNVFEQYDRSLPILLQSANNQYRNNATLTNYRSLINQQMNLANISLGPEGSILRQANFNMNGNFNFNTIENFLAKIPEEKLTPVLLQLRDNNSHERQLFLNWLPTSARDNQYFSLFYHTFGLLPDTHPLKGKYELFEHITNQLGLTNGTTETQKSFPLIKTLLRGARSQAAITTTLETEGLFVLVPDPNNEDDIRKFDLKGIDLITVDKNGEVFLIDAKSSNQDVKSPQTKPLHPVFTPEAKTVDGRTRIDTETRIMLVEALKKYAVDPRYKHYHAQIQEALDNSSEPVKGKFMVPEGYYNSAGIIKDPEMRQELVKALY